MFLPNNIQIELVEGCNRMCNFCGIHGIWKNKYDRKIKHMPYDLAEQIAASLSKWPGFTKKRVEFAMHGEPTLNPELLNIVDMFRTRLPRAQMQLTTNGLTSISRGSAFVESLFECGLNILMVDMYVRREEIGAVMKRVRGVRLINYYNKTDFNPYYYNDNKSKTIILIDDLGENNNVKKQRKILNHAGNGNPKLLEQYGVESIQLPLSKKCSRVFREMVIHYDGSIPLCCIDWKHEFVVGMFPADGEMQHIWESRMFNIMRYKLFNKWRLARPCYKCDYNGGFRLGLLNGAAEEVKTDISARTTSEYELEQEIQAHLKCYAKYAHPNATDQPLITKKAAGIKAWTK